jgi:hypothetical protein
LEDIEIGINISPLVSSLLFYFIIFFAVACFAKGIMVARPIKLL